MIHLTPEQINILEDAINKWGIDSQIKMLREEFLETAIEIGKFYERDATHTRYLKVLSEIADATIMVYQMQLIPEMKQGIQNVINSKLKRLEERVKSSPTKVETLKSILISNKDNEIYSLNNRNKNLIQVIKTIRKAVNLKESNFYEKGKHISEIVGELL